MSLRARFVTEIGYNLEYYEYLKDYKDIWGNQLFTLDESKVKALIPKAQKYDYISNEDLNLSQLELREVDKQYFQYRFNTNVKLNIIHDKIEQEIQLENEVPYKLNDITERNAKLIAVGGHITSMQWLPQDLMGEVKPKVSYLAIGVVIGEDRDLKDVNPTNAELNIFNNTREKNLNSSIQIWQYNTENNEFELYKVFITSAFGAVSELQWAPIYTDDPILGVLTCVFKDGKVHLLKIETSAPNYSIIEKSSFSYSSESKKNKNSHFTCFSYSGPHRILAGNTEGYITEFQTPFYYKGDDLAKPNYKTFMSNGPISNITCVKNPDNPNDYINVVNGQGHKGVAFTSRNPVSEVFSPLVEKSNIKPTYNHTLQNILLAYNLEYSNVASFRSLQDSEMTMFKFDSHITSAKMSEILGHPFMLTGTTNGEIILINYTRKFLTARGRNKMLNPLIMWKFLLNPSRDKKGKNSKDELSLITTFSKTEMESNLTTTFSDKEIMISSLAWNENAIGASIYAAGTASGVLIVERLDPNFA
ncbi:hypothetical protein KGF54_004255 [Candida jiufengensis]|uniref:uncharacterized protein n=1 Tax=Candida jiufengensis TaxID=497108 RepID=UPI002224FD17|nr:uncharacterized protein KGF54_004255 [Candida jiufengensis]KAI5951181.1 hypothetical protein KGF54_004255 [Candida jiufengensis]